MVNIKKILTGSAVFLALSAIPEYSIEHDPIFACHRDAPDLIRKVNEGGNLSIEPNRNDAVGRAYMICIIDKLYEALNQNPTRQKPYI